MASLNKVTLIGRVGNDPETKEVNGTTVARFNLATTETHKTKSGEKVEQTEWHRVEVWDSLANLVEKYLKKGTLVYVEGKIRTDRWNSNGVDKTAVTIRGMSMTMLSGPPEAKKQQPAPATTAPRQTFSEDESDDLPF